MDQATLTFGVGFPSIQLKAKGLLSLAAKIVSDGLKGCLIFQI